jgi:hypothetical protein
MGGRTRPWVQKWTSVSVAPKTMVSTRTLPPRLGASTPSGALNCAPRLQRLDIIDSGCGATPPERDWSRGYVHHTPRSAFARPTVHADAEASVTQH